MQDILSATRNVKETPQTPQTPQTQQTFPFMRHDEGSKSYRIAMAEYHGNTCDAANEVWLRRTGVFLLSALTAIIFGITAKLVWGLIYG